MSKQLHHRKKDDKYALYSTVVDDYVTEWGSKEEIRKEWYLLKFKNSIEEVDRWMEESPDEEV